jgi:WD40 repeat protein
MYLYDINNQQYQSSNSSSSSSSSNQTPNFQSIIEGEGYSVYSNVTKNSKNNNENSGSFKLTNGSSNFNNNDHTNSNNSISNNSSNSNNNNPLTRWQLTSCDSHSLSGINEFSFSPCGQYIAVACQDGSLRLFNYKEMSFRSSMKSYFGGLLCISWSQDGCYIATGGEDDLITIFSFHENRVACRCRGHSSWVNSVHFDNWSQSYNDYSRMNLNSNENENDQDSDFEEYHNKKVAANDINNKNQLNVKKRTTSGSSNFSRQHSVGMSNKRMSLLSDYEQLFNTSKSLFYRLGSVGQDNKIAFWDLNEDVLKEKTHSRSRVTSIVTTINQQSDNLINKDENSFTTSGRHHNHDEQPNSGAAITNSGTTTTSSGLSFFKKNKRNATSISNKNSLNKTNQLQKINSKDGLQQKFSNLNLNSVLCPKLDEVPIIEPLICKRISQERLTSLIFKEDSFLVASQNGTVSTWARPGKVILVDNS